MDHIVFYQQLEVKKSASAAEIKKAYRKLARKYHPDLNPNNTIAEKKYKEINEANEVLSDPNKRKKYDQHGDDCKHAADFEKARKQQSQPSGGYSQQFAADDLSDIFGSMFGGGGKQRRQSKSKGQDFNTELQLNLTDVYTSLQQTLSVNGKNIRLTFPAGIENGQIIKVAGHGAPGINGGASGDLYITFSIINNTKFKREGNNLSADVDVALYTALLGGEVIVDAFTGKVKLKISPETQSGTKVKLRRKGFPIYKKENEYGDLFITYYVKLPKNLTEKETQLFTELRKINDAVVAQ